MLARMSDPGREASPPLPATGPAREPREQEPRRILLVEDDDGDALLVEELLMQAWPALDLSRARTLSEAEPALAAGVDCVVLDLGLPDVVGIDAVRRVREADGELPVVVLTGDADEDRGIEALGTGAQDYLVKGAISGSGLARAVRHSVQRKLAERFARELAVLRVQSAENARVQRGLVARPIVEDPTLEIRSAYRPGNRRQVLGGDFFDVVQSGPDSLQLMLGDVCGHGPDEAALGVQLRIAWRTLILAGVEHDQVLRTLHRLLVQERHADHIYATLASVRVGLRDDVASVALAGHPPPILLDDRGPLLLRSEVPGQPLGLADPAEWEFVDVRMPARWSLLLYSDGIYEGHVGEPRGRLGIDGLLDVLAGEPPGGGRSAASGLWAAPGRLIDRIEQLNDGPLDDDVAVLVVTRDGR
jgi:serine phosphatase RsbU (regulator of sigma subunit)